MTTTYCRVTVVSGNRHVDLALPSVLPVSDVVPQILRFCSPGDRPDRPSAWTLARLGGSSISLEHSLADAGVLDGDVLELRSVEASPRPAYVEDVRDAIEDAVDESGGQWRTETSRGFILVVSAIGLALMALLSFARRPDQPQLIAGGILVAVLAVACGWWPTARKLPVPTQLVLAAGCLWGGVAGWLIGTSLGGKPPVALAAGLVTALLVAIAARVVTALAMPHVAGLAMLTGAAVIAAVAGQLWQPLTPERIDAVLAILVIGVLPRVSVSVGGLATADYRVRKSTLITQQDLADRVRQSSALLFGAVLGAAIVGSLAGVVLANSESLWDRLLGLAVGLSLLLRSRVFSQILHLTPLRIAGSVVLAVQALRLAELPQVRPWSVALAGVAVAALIAISALPLSDITGARVKRVLNWTETVVVVVMIALAAASVGLYDIVAKMMN